MTRICVLLCLSVALPGVAQDTKSTPEINVIHGDNHIFTVETPEGWINDKEAASTINLVSFFYAKSDSKKSKRSYIYAMGYDKDGQNKDLKSFMDGDLRKLKRKYPTLVHEEIAVGASGGIINAKMYAFDNLSDRYREEVIYMETKESILVFSFAALTKSDYESYQPVFDKFVSSFNYRGNDPKHSLTGKRSKNNLVFLIETMAIVKFFSPRILPIFCLG